MSKTKIAWTDETWNPTRGCSRVSEVVLDQKKLLEPLRWRRWRKRRVFVNSDLFHEHLGRGPIAQVFSVMALTPHITYQVLTKRAMRMFHWFDVDVDNTEEFVGAWMRTHSFGADPGIPDWPLPNVHLGVSVESQATAGERIPWLLKTPAEKRFVSYEPALGPVDFLAIPQCMEDCEPRQDQIDSGYGAYYLSHGAPGIDQIIVGGESGPDVRDWIESTIDQCRRAGVKCFVKQLGSNPNWDGDGAKDMSRWPEALRVRELV